MMTNSNQLMLGYLEQQLQAVADIIWLVNLNTLPNPAIPSLHRLQTWKTLTH
jgi:hypothetical protein